ncbi:hypothetical protein P4S64_21465 [Vibrio sp. M60_M31a]
MGVSIFPEFSIDALIQSGDVVALFPEWEVREVIRKR